MTTLAADRAAQISASALKPTASVRMRAWAPAATGLVTVAWWLGPVVRGWGGRESGTVTIGALLLAAALVTVRPHRHLPASATILATALSAAAFVVAATSPSGWAGARVAASYACASWLLLVVAAVVRQRSVLVPWLAGMIAAAAALEFAEAWLPWWGGEDPTKPMIGTFYWHDPYAAFLLPGALIGLWLWVRSSRALALVGLLGCILGSIGIVYSTSRAALACLALGVLAIAAGTLMGADRRRSLLRLLSASATTVAATYLVAGPPFFPHRVSATAGIASRAAGQSLGQNGGYRLEFWHEALSLFGRHPVTGGGYHSLVAESVGHVPRGWALSPYAHNGYLQVLSDGGLLLAVPFLLAVASLTVLATGSLIRAVRLRRPTLGMVAVPLAFMAVLMHSAVDFDWTYPANLCLAALLGGLVLGIAPRLRMESAPELVMRRAGARRALAAASVAGVALLGLSAWTARHGDLRENLPVASGQQAVKATHTFADRHGEIPSVTTKGRT